MWRTTRRGKRLEPADGPSWVAAFRGLGLWCLALLSLAGAPSASALELTPPQAALYTTVSIYPPSAGSMTVCYGFVCRRREIFEFTPADRKALTKILAAGRASASCRAIRTVEADS